MPLRLPARVLLLVASSVVSLVVVSLVVIVSLVVFALIIFTLIGRRHDGAVEPVVFVVGSRTEEQRGSRLTSEVVPESDPPQPLDHQHLIVGGSHLPSELIVVGVERVDRAVAKVAD